MKKNLFKLLAIMLCFMFALTACSKDDTDEDDNRRDRRRTVTDAPEEDKPTEAITDAPTVTVTDAPTVTDVPTEDDINTSNEGGNNTVTTAPTEEPTPEPTAEPTVEPTAVPTEEPTPEPTSEPIVNDGDFDFSGITEDGRALSKEELVSLAKTISKIADYDKSYMYMDTDMSMAMGGQSMDVTMTETLYKYDNIQHLIAYTNMMGSDTKIESYSVTKDADNVETYTSYDGGVSWSKSGSAAATLDIPMGTDFNEFAQLFKDGYIKETSTGYTVTGQMRVEEDGLMLMLDCEIYLDTKGKVTRYMMSLGSPFEGEEDGVAITMTKFDIEFEYGCDEIVIPAEALNAKEFDINDLSGLLDGLAS